MTEDIVVELVETGQVDEVWLDHPPANTLSRAFVTQLIARLLEAAASPSDVVVLRGRGRFFSAGGHIHEIARLTDREADAFLLQGRLLLQTLTGMPKPTIAVLEGPAYGGGLELALACDLRLATPAATVGLPESELGILPGFGGTQLLRGLLRRDQALVLVATGAKLPADEALELGLLTEVVAQERLAERLEALTAGFTRLPSHLSRAIKRSIQVGWEPTGLDVERDHYERVWSESGTREGLIRRADDMASRSGKAVSS